MLVLAHKRGRSRATQLISSRLKTGIYIQVAPNLVILGDKGNQIESGVDPNHACNCEER